MGATDPDGKPHATRRQIALIDAEFRDDLRVVAWVRDMGHHVEPRIDSTLPVETDTRYRPPVDNRAARPFMRCIQRGHDVERPHLMDDRLRRVSTVHWVGIGEQRHIGPQIVDANLADQALVEVACLPAGEGMGVGRPRMRMRLDELRVGQVQLMGAVLRKDPPNPRSRTVPSRQAGPTTATRTHAVRR